MQIEQIPLDRLSVSAINMRRGRRVPDVSDIQPSIAARGVLSPLFVRAGGKPGAFEILAGKRRYFASVAAAKDSGEDRPLPCIVIDEGDDAEALEISMIENLLREDPDEVTQWESFTRLVKEGRTVGDIAASFALSEAQVTRILALGDLLPRIREAYRGDEIDAATVRHLTLASKAQQKAWLDLFEDEDAHAPRASQLKAWLFGGSSIATGVALFDLDAYSGNIVADLFGEQGYFADSEAFWKAQMAEVEKRKAAYLEQGWRDVAIVPAIEYFSTWEYESCAKEDGGRVYIQLRTNGEVVFHEGYVSRREAQAARRGTGDEDARPARPELTGPLAEYIDLHRHAAVRERLAGEPALALRAMVAHAICGSPLWSVSVAETRSRKEMTEASLAGCVGVAAFAERRARMFALLGFEQDRETLCRDRYGADIVALLARLGALDDVQVMEVLALAMAETLAVGGEAVEYLGEHMGVEMADHWHADEAFFAVLRDREVLAAILSEVGGEAVASAHAKESGPAVKRVIADHLTGANERDKVERWVPRWMAFPPAAYTERGGVPTVTAARRARWQLDGEAGSEAASVDPDGA